MERKHKEYAAQVLAAIEKGSVLVQPDPERRSRAELPPPLRARLSGYWLVIVPLATIGAALIAAYGLVR